VPCFAAPVAPPPIAADCGGANSALERYLPFRHVEFKVCVVLSMVVFLCAVLCFICVSLLVLWFAVLAAVSCDRGLVADDPLLSGFLSSFLLLSSRCCV